MENSNVTLSKKQYEEIMNEIKQIKKGGIQKPKRVKEHTATLRTFKEQPVVEYGRVYSGKNEFNEDRLYMEIVLEDGAKDKVDYLQFLNSEGDYVNNSVSVKILKQIANEKIDTQGTIRKENPDEAKVASSKFEGGEVELTVTSVKYDIEIEITSGELSGKVLTVANEALNV